MLTSLTRFIRYGIIAVFHVAIASVTPAFADYPTRPIVLIVPYGESGASDLAARALAQVAPQYIGQPVSVVNRPGAGGVAGASLVRYAVADGYTLLLARIGSHTVAPAMKANLPYQYDDFTFIGLLEQNPIVCATSSEKPFRNFEELIDTIKQNPRSLSYSSAGVGTVLQMAVALIFDAVGVNDPTQAAIHVPFDSGGGATAAVLSGRVDFVCTNLSPLVAEIQSGRLRGLLVTTPERVAAIPDVPTVAELGHPELEILIGWSALAGPPGLDDDVVERWVQLLDKLKSDPTWLALAKSRGAISKILPPVETKAFIDRQYREFSDLVTRLDMWVR